jgi:hypothetical protein
VRFADRLGLKLLSAFVCIQQLGRQFTMGAFAVHFTAEHSQTIEHTQLLPWHLQIN